MLLDLFDIFVTRVLHSALSNYCNNGNFRFAAVSRPFGQQQHLWLKSC